MKGNVRFITTAAIIAALYVVLGVIFLPINFGVVQFRIPEILTVLPYFTPAAIYGLFVGCIIANLIGGNGLWDVVLGSLATLLAAYLSYKMPKKFLVPLPPVIVNALIVGPMLSFLLQWPLLLSVASVGAGQLVVCYILGYPFLLVLDKFKNTLFRSR